MQIVRLSAVFLSLSKTGISIPKMWLLLQEISAIYIYIYTYIWRFHKWRYTPNSSIFIRCSLISHPCGGSPMTMDPPRSTWCSHDVLSTKDGDKCLASCPKGKYVEYQGPQRPGEASKGSPKVPKVVAMDMMEILASEV